MNTNVYLTVIRYFGVWVHRMKLIFAHSCSLFEVLTSRIFLRQNHRIAIFAAICSNNRKNFTKVKLRLWCGWRYRIVVKFRLTCHLTKRWTPPPVEVISFCNATTAVCFLIFVTVTFTRNRHIVVYIWFAVEPFTLLCSWRKNTKQTRH